MMLINHSVAFDYVKKLLPSKGYRVKMVSPVNKGRHLLIECSNVKTPDVYQYFYVLYKHTFVHSFNEMFPEFVSKYPSLAGQGESINVEFAEYARRRDAILLFVYESGAVYSIYANALIKICTDAKLQRIQSRRNEYKIQYGDGETQIVNEETYTFPIKLMERFN